MDRSNYKRLGDYIRSVDVRNRDLAVTNLLGVSISKTFIPSIANTIGTDMSTYKVVEPYQFAYGPVTSRNGDKITFALYKGNEKCIISQAYETFEIVDKEQLDPDYLMMWALRPEFDRYARFKSNGSAREIFSWDEMCEVYLPVPDIATQRRIVAEYQAVEERIATNNKLIETLTSTIQSIFFDSIVSKSSNENLPNGWSRAGLKDIASFMNGAACQKFPSEKGAKSLPVIKIKEIGRGMFDENSDRVSLDIPTKYLIHDGDTLFSWSASLIVDFWCGGTGALNQHIFKVTSDKYPQWFYHLWIQQHIDEWNNFISAKATSMGHIKQEDLESAAVIIPDDNTLCTLDKQLSPITDYLITIKREYIRLQELRSLLLSRLSNI